MWASAPVMVTGGIGHDIHRLSIVVCEHQDRQQRAHATFHRLNIVCERQHWQHHCVAQWCRRPVQNRLVRTLLDQGFRYGLLCRKFKQFYRSHFPWSNVIPTLWRSISGRVSIVRFGDGASAFCWLEQRWLAPTDYQFTLSPVSPWLFPPSFPFVFILFIFISVLLIFKLIIDFFLLLSFFLSLLSFLFFSFLLSPPSFFFFFFLISVSSTLYHLSMRVFVMSIDSTWVYCVSHGDNVST